MEEKPPETGRWVLLKEKSARPLHAALAIAVIFMGISGLALYLPNLRSITADFRWLLSQGHNMIGFLVPLLLLLNIPYFLTPAVLKKTDASQGNIVLLLGVVIIQTVTGFTLYLHKTGNLETPFIAAQTHVLIALFFFPILIIHIYRTRTAKGTDASAPSSPDAEAVSRRRFIFSLGALLTFAGTWSGVEWLKDHLSSTVKSETLSLYEDCNKMIPQPTPSRGLGAISGGYTGRFQVYTVTAIPCANSDTWSFSVEGLVRNPVRFRWSDFLGLPRVVQVSDFHCIDGWSVKQVTYEGISLALLLENAGLQPEARFVKFISDDGAYSDALSIEQAMMPDVIVAILADGQPIPSSLGGPARLIIPKMFAYKSVKWLTKIELTDQPHLGYWEQRGYQVDACTHRNN